MHAPEPPVIDARDLCRTYPGPPEVGALVNASFTIDRGEYVAVTGPSGSGKSTLLSLLGLLDTPTSGRYLLDGVDVSDLDDDERAGVRAHRIGFVFQAFHLLGYRTVLDNVELGLLYQGVARRQRRRLARDVLVHVGLDPRRGALCAQLSGGEKQRVAIARTLVRRPSLVLCDEPTGNLDSSSSAQILELLAELNAEGLTVIVITHDRAVAQRAERNLTVADGRVLDGDATGP